LGAEAAVSGAIVLLPMISYSKHRQFKKERANVMAVEKPRSSALKMSCLIDIQCRPAI